MGQCPIELIDAAVGDRLSKQQSDSLCSHLSECESCRQRLDQAAASPQWWGEVQRLLDIAQLDDPNSDVADSSASDARLFEGDDPVGELKAAGVIDSPPHPEMLGKLGRYSIEREIGTGGMGVVLKGFDPELNRTVAIKVLAPHLARSGAARERFVREGRAAAAVVHENVVAIHEVDTSRRLPTLVMRYVDGVSLQRRVDTVGPLPICDALRIASQTAAGLAAAHRQGIVHRDVKPANILVSASGQRVWITDFGLARAVDDASLTRTGFIAGTPHYMSPEQARGSTVGPTSDLFSLGAVIYFMLAARPPWRADRSLAVLHRIVQEQHRPLWQVNPDVPREVSDLVDELLSKSAGDRQLTASDVQNRLESILSDLQNPIGPHSVSAERSLDRPTQRWFARPWVLIPLTVAITGMVMTFAPRLPRAISSWQSEQRDSPEVNAPAKAHVALGSYSADIPAADSSLSGIDRIGSPNGEWGSPRQPSNPTASHGQSEASSNDLPATSNDPVDRWGRPPETPIADEPRQANPGVSALDDPGMTFPGDSVTGNGENLSVGALSFPGTFTPAPPPNRNLFSNGVADVAGSSELTPGEFQRGETNPANSQRGQLQQRNSPQGTLEPGTLEPATTIPNSQMESLFELDRMLDEAESLLSVPPEVTHSEWSRA